MIIMINKWGLYIPSKFWSIVILHNAQSSANLFISRQLSHDFSCLLFLSIHITFQNCSLIFVVSYLSTCSIKLSRLRVNIFHKHSLSAILNVSSFVIISTHDIFTGWWLPQRDVVDLFVIPHLERLKFFIYLQLVKPTVQILIPYHSRLYQNFVPCLLWVAHSLDRNFYVHD